MTRVLPQAPSHSLCMPVSSSATHSNHPSCLVFGLQIQVTNLALCVAADVAER